MILQDLLVATLQGLEEQWRRLDAPIAHRLRPGLSFDEIDSRAAEHGWQLPWEFRIWWQWHDGADDQGPRHIGPGGFDFLTLDEALRRTEHEYTFNANNAPLVWNKHWLCFMTQDAQRLYADCRSGSLRDRTSPPIGLVSLEWENADVPVAPSLLAAADLWRWMLEQDLFHVLPNGVLFPVDFKAWPLWLRATQFG